MAPVCKGCLALVVLIGLVMGTAAQKNVYKTKDAYVAAYHMLQCKASNMVTPSSTAGVSTIVKQWYNKARAGTPVTLRVSRPKFHSTATFVCPISSGPAAKPQTTPAVTLESGKKTAAAAGTTVGLLQSNLNKVLAVDKKKFTMRVGAGMRVTELLPAATKAGMSVMIGALPAYAGLTLAGILATSAHGSGDKTVSHIADMVLEVTWVDGTGKVHVSKKSDPEFKAFFGGLGVYGVITELLLQMTPPTLTRLRTFDLDDKNMMKDIDRLLKLSPHILIHWRPDSGKFRAFLIDDAPAGSKRTPGFINMTVLPNLGEQSKVASMFTTWHTSMNDDSDMLEFVCPIVSDTSLSATWAELNGESAMNLTGPTNNLQASECDEHCTWNDREVINGTATDSEFTMDFSLLADWIKDVKKVFNVELRESGKAAFRCMGLGYMWIRFGKNYDGVTATNSGINRPVYVQSTWLRSRADDLYPMRYKFVIDLIEEVTLCKYKARPHWGKNFDRTFTHPRCPVVPMYPKFNQLLGLSKKYDPAGMFRTRLFNRMVNKKAFEYSPRCAAINTCFCQKDIHCPVGHKCVKSLAFPAYKVCKAPMKNVRNSLLPQMMNAVMAG